MPLEQILTYKVTTTKGTVESSLQGYDYCFEYIAKAHAYAHKDTPTANISPVVIASMEIKMKVLSNSLTNEGEVLSFKCEDSAKLTKVYNMRDWL